MRGTLADRAWLFSAALSALVSGAACGGGTPSEADGPEDGMKVTHHGDGPGGSVSGGGEEMHVEGTVGGLSKTAVQRTFNEARPKMKGCIEAGRKQQPYLGGDFDVALEIDGSGKATSVLLPKSNIGSHEAEACITKVLASTQWPRPVGGKLGKATSAFGWHSDHIDPPMEWSADQLASAMNADRDPDEEDPGPPPFAELEAKLTRCRTEAGAGPLDLTLVMDEDGMLQSYGVSRPDAQAAKTIGCFGTVLQTTSLPAPGGNYAKVTVRVK